MRFKGLITVALLTATALLAACSSAPAATTNITVTLTDKEIALSQSDVDAGSVTFTIVNKGTTVHSLVLMKSDLPHDNIPADPKDPAKVQETGSIAVTGQLAVGASMQLSRKLVAGNYVLVCNEPAHYIVGMHTGLVVK
jgi:uncharacterized cupredoxin-like copper-binding protein